MVRLMTFIEKIARRAIASSGHAFDLHGVRDDGATWAVAFSREGDDRLYAFSVAKNADKFPGADDAIAAHMADGLKAYASRVLH